MGRELPIEESTFTIRKAPVRFVANDRRVVCDHVAICILIIYSNDPLSVFFTKSTLYLLNTVHSYKRVSHIRLVILCAKIVEVNLIQPCD
jgi:hypothetical protein